MEQLFMQVFERRDWVAAQVQQQADSYAQTLACTLLAAGHRPPDWLLPSRDGGPQQELNGRPIVPGLVFTGSQITTPSANRRFFLPPAIPSTLIRKSEVPKAYTETVNNCAALSTLVALDADQHEEPQPEQTSLSKELANTCAEDNMFSRIQRSKSRKKNIEDHRCGRDQAANSGSRDGMNRSKLGAVGSNRTTDSSSSRSCGDVANNAETTSSCPGQANGFYASQGRSTDLLKCPNNLESQENQLDCLLSLGREDKIMCSDNSSSARDLKIAPLSEHSDLNIENTMCPTMPETHLLVEPKKLRFDVAESVCMDTISEQTGKQQESALEIDHFGFADQNLLSEDPYPTSQEPHSMGRLSLDGLKSDYLISVNVDMKHNQYGLESGHHDLSALHPLNEEPSLICSTEVTSFVGDPLLSKNTLYVPEIGSKLSQTQEMLTGNPASELVNCHSGKLGDDVHVKKAHGSLIENKMDQAEAPKLISSVSSGRIRKMHETERSSATPSEICNGSLRQEGIEQEIPRVDNDVPNNAEACMVQNIEHVKSSHPSMQFCLRSSVSYEKNNQLQANRGDGRKRLVADGIQVNTSSKRKRIKCQDITRSNSSRTNSSSLNHQDGIGIHVVTAENLSGRSRPSGRYLLWSSGFNEFMSLKAETKNAATNSKVSIASDLPETGDISPILVKNSHQSNVAICDSSRGEALSPCFIRGNDSRSAVEGMDFQNSQAQFQTNFDVSATSALPHCSNIAPDIEECCGQEENYCLEGVGLNVNISSVKHQEMAIQMDDTVILVNQENCSGTGSLTTLPSHDLDQHGKQTSDLVASVHKKLSFDSGVKLDPRCESEDPARFTVSNATILRHEGDEPINCNNILPEFECFDVSLPVDSPTTEKRTYEALCDPTRFDTLSLDISSKYKVHTVSGMHQLVATMSEKATSCSFSGDVRQYSMSSDDSIADIFGSSGLGISGSFLPSDIIASCSSNDSDNHMSGEKPLTPAVEKYSLGKLSARVGSVSEHMGSIPELSCFRIDEDSGIAEENEYQDMLPESIGNQVQSGRKALQDITGLCQNTENYALNSLGSMDTANIDLTTETCSSKLDQNSGLKNDRNNKKPKESSASLVKREGKVAHSLRNRLSKTEQTDNRNQRNMSDANLGKLSKPRNIVANVASFIPLVKPKPSTTACVKKDVRVKALEAAEAAKRLEEKKQIEREMRKAAAKLEREKMRKEKESKQKQEQEQKKKQDTDVATRKRQRDEEERREKERKRRCAEEARKQQKQPTERRLAGDEKDAHPTASDNKELRKNLVEVVKSEVKPDERVLGNKAITSNNDIVVDERPASFGSHAIGNIPNGLDESYVMTPYKDSDDEDDEEEASRRRKKLKPSWVREENLVKILLSDNQALDPREIFAQKCSFNLSNVLPVHVPLRGFK